MTKEKKSWRGSADLSRQEDSRSEDGLIRVMSSKDQRQVSTEMAAFLKRRTRKKTGERESRGNIQNLKMFIKV